MTAKKNSRTTTTCRFDAETLRRMDALAEYLKAETGLRCSRMDVVRIAVKELAERKLVDRR